MSDLIQDGYLLDLEWLQNEVSNQNVKTTLQKITDEYIRLKAIEQAAIDFAKCRDEIEYNDTAITRRALQVGYRQLKELLQID